MLINIVHQWWPMRGQRRCTCIWCLTVCISHVVGTCEVGIITNLLVYTYNIFNTHTFKHWYMKDTGAQQQASNQGTHNSLCDIVCQPASRKALIIYALQCEEKTTLYKHVIVSHALLLESWWAEVDGKPITACSALMVSQSASRSDLLPLTVSLIREVLQASRLSSSP